MSGDPFKRPQVVAWLALPFFSANLAGWIGLVSIRWIALNQAGADMMFRMLLICVVVMPPIFAFAMLFTPLVRRLWREGSAST